MKKSLLLAGVALLLAAAPASASVPTTEINPGDLPRGEDIAIPHLEGRVIVDGDTRIRVSAPRVALLGKSGTSYVVHTTGADGSTNGRTYRVHPDGTKTLLGRAQDASELLLSDEGDHLVRTHMLSHERTALRVTDVDTGDVVATRTFRGWIFSLDAANGRVLLSSWSPARTTWWNFVSDKTRRVVGRTGGVADIAADRLGSYTGDPYDGGCYVISSLKHPTDVLWRTCGERAIAFSPDGRRVATVGIVDDGIGPAQVTVRRVARGAALARYATKWFGAVRWESATALLLDANGARKAATVRCVLADCERASDLTPVPEY
ncbi:hypothetical protein [Nocardioides sp. T2.26MG-1]|uniref:hypothetical protein n=1 Tax=Nocardioides sp. T2.26MG-1 TaxID=3041166 RepID=UPI002477B531|nr:hypothetical protein [Nocardioides sp. T2.26MG-1]CAI9419472.1 hypothetical protein HIDPHFAB_03709 [Nocardioides sp. T2.26MG-1]